MDFNRPNIKVATNDEIKWENKEDFKHGKVGRSFTSRSVLQHYLLPIPFIVMLWTYVSLDKVTQKSRQNSKTFSSYLNAFNLDIHSNVKYVSFHAQTN